MKRSKRSFYLQQSLNIIASSITLKGCKRTISRGGFTRMVEGRVLSTEICISWLEQSEYSRTTTASSSELLYQIFGVSYINLFFSFSFVKLRVISSIKFTATKFFLTASIEFLLGLHLTVHQLQSYHFSSPAHLPDYVLIIFPLILSSLGASYSLMYLGLEKILCREDINENIWKWQSKWNIDRFSAC